MLIEVIELICTAAVTYSTVVAIDYRFDRILHELGDFLKFIRESSDNFSRNPYKINRNNSISVIYLLCRLIMFKDNVVIDGEMQNICSQMNDQLTMNGTRKEYHATLFASSFNQSAATNDQTNSDSFVSASSETFDHMLAMSASKTIWVRELEIALIDYALMEFYPVVHDLIAIALKVGIFWHVRRPHFLPHLFTFQLTTYKSTNQIKLLLNTSESFRSAIKLMKEPTKFTDEMYLSEGMEAINVLPVLQCDELVQNLFNAISK